VTAGLQPKSSEGYYAPSGNSGDTYNFQSIDNSHQVAVTVTKESDGKYYVTKVETS
jgi:hypothetical protein